MGQPHRGQPQGPCGPFPLTLWITGAHKHCLWITKAVPMSHKIGGGPLQRARRGPSPGLAMAPITIYASTMSGITWKAVTDQAVSEHLLMIEISKAGKRAAVGGIAALGCHLQDLALSSAVRHPEISLGAAGAEVAPDRASSEARPWASSSGAPSAWAVLAGDHPVGSGALPRLPGDGADRSPPP